MIKTQKYQPTNDDTISNLAAIPSAWL